MKRRILSLLTVFLLIISSACAVYGGAEAERIFIDVSQSSDNYCAATGGKETFYSNANGKYISFNSGDWQEFDFTVPYNGEYVISVYAGLGSNGPVSALSIYDFKTGQYKEVARKAIKPNGSYSEFAATVMGTFELKAGANRIKLSETFSDIHLNGVEIVPKMAEPIKYDVSQSTESYNASNGGTEDIRSNASGNFSTFSQNDYYIFDVNMPYADTFDLTVYAGTKKDNTETEILAYNEKTQEYETVITKAVNNNGSNMHFEASDMGEITLKRGVNKIKVLQTAGEIRMSAIELSKGDTEYFKLDVREASDSLNYGSGQKEGLAKDAQGNFFVSFNGNDTQDFVINTEKAGTYSITVLAGLVGNAKTSLLQYDETSDSYQKIEEKAINKSGSLSVFGETELGEVEFAKGYNRIRLKQVSSDIHLHGIIVRYVKNPEPIVMDVSQSTEGKTSQGEDEGYIGTSVKYISFNTGDYQIFDMKIERSGRYRISATYGLASSGPVTEFGIYNDETASYDVLTRNVVEPTGDFNTFKEFAVGEYNLGTGDLRLRLKQLYSDIHFSSIKLEYIGKAKTEFEVLATDTTLTTADVGEKLLTFETPQRADYSVTVPESGSYEVVAFVTEAWVKIPQISLWENNVELASARVPNLTTNNICVPLSLGTVNLTAGEHNFRVRHSGVTTSKFLFEKLVFTKVNEIKSITITDSSYIKPFSSNRAQKVKVTEDGAVFEENGVLTFDANVDREGYYLWEPEFAGDSADLVITANEKVVANGSGELLIYLYSGRNDLTVSTHEVCELSGIRLTYLPELDEEIINAFVEEINGAKRAEQIKAILDDYEEAFGFDMESLLDGIFYKTAVYQGLIDRNFNSAEEIISELKNLSLKEKTNPCVALYDGTVRKDALQSGDLTFKVSSDKMRENLSVVAAIYDGARLKKVAKGDYTGAENELSIYLGKTELAGTETFKLISLDNLTDISPVNIRDNIEAEIFVSPSGNDENDGISAPVKTIKKAQELVSALTENMTGDIIVNIAEGTYFEGETLVFDDSHGGKNGYKVIYKGNKATISGGIKAENFEEYKNGIYYTSLDGVTDVRNLYVNGYPATKARTKFAFWAEETYKSEGATLDFDGILIKDEHFPEINSGAQSLELVMDASWETQRFPVTDVLYDGDAKIILLDERVLAYNTPVEGTALSASKMVYLENHLSLLDEPGEFFYDRDTKLLYYYPLAGENINECEIVAGAVEGLVNVSGTENAKTENITFSGLAFKYGAWNEVSDNGFIGTQSDAITNTQTGEEKMIPAQFEISWAKNIEISDCVFTCLGSAAVKAGNGAESVEIKGNLFRDIAATGVQIGNFEHGGEQTKERTRDITVLNNAFVRCGFEHRSCSAVSAYYVNNVRIAHNYINSLPYSGMTAGWGWGGADPEGWGGITIEKNKFDTVMQSLDDGGGVYLLGHMKNSKITGNYFNKVGRTSSSMYADSGTGYAEFSNNVSTNSRQWLTIANIGLHDVRVRGNYSDTSRGLITSNEYVNENNVNNIKADNLPEGALAIVENAGLEEKYAHLALGNELPEGRESMIFASPKTSYYVGYKFEAEDCKSYTSGIVYANAYLGFNNLSSAVFDVTVPEAGSYMVRAVIATPGSSSKIGVLQGGVVTASADITATGTGYANYMMQEVGTITLPKGTSELTLKSLRNAFHVDCFILEPLS